MCVSLSLSWLSFKALSWSCSWSLTYWTSMRKCLTTKHFYELLGIRVSDFLEDKHHTFCSIQCCTVTFWYTYSLYTSVCVYILSQVAPDLYSVYIYISPTVLYICIVVLYLFSSAMLSFVLYAWLSPVGISHLGLVKCYLILQM